jgi:hypothetical protein
MSPVTQQDTETVILTFVREKGARAGESISLDDLYNRVNEEGIEYIEFYDEALDHLTEEGLVTVAGLEMTLTHRGDQRVRRDR